MKTTKEKVRDWWVSYGKLWTKRIFEYFFLAVLFSFVGAVLFVYFDLAQTDADSARYMLSALVQSQAAIVAIVISLTLIAVQLSASAYSPRVIRIFRNNPDVWLLLGLYGMSIFYGLLILKTIRDGDLSKIPLFNYPIETHIISVYFLGIFSFLMLFRYILSIIDLLNPTNIINRLKIDITKDNILNSQEDPIQPIMDIIHGSIMKYDLETTRVGLKAVTDQVLEIIGPDDEKKILEWFCNHLYRVSRLAISKEDEDSTVEVIKCLAKFGKSTAEKKLKDAISQVTETLGGVGGDSVKKGLEFATSDALNYLGKVGSAAAKNKLKDVAKQAAGIIGFVGKKSAEKGFEEATAAARSLRDVGIAAAENELEEATSEAAKSLNGVGIAAAENKLEDAAGEAAQSLGVVGKSAVEKGLKLATRSAALSLVYVGIAAVGNKLEEVTSLLSELLAELTISSEEIVKTAIRENKSTLKEQDSESFQKFMKLYEQELEKLRAKK